MVTDNWYFVNSQIAKSGVRECYSVHKVFLMFKVYILFNTAQLAGGIFCLFGFGGAGHLSVLIVIFLLHIYIYLELLPLEAIF